MRAFVNTFRQILARQLLFSVFSGAKNKKRPKNPSEDGQTHPFCHANDEEITAFGAGAPAPRTRKKGGLSHA
ncbi:MAG: hypothetical protein J6T24_10530 [Clostridia bacterium]|nr:hypothetical protein [Clostridia bacterium]